MLRRLFFVAAATAALASGACSDSKKSSSAVSVTTAGGSKADATDIGQQLYSGEYKAAHSGDRPADPLTIPLANVMVLDKLELSSKVEGTIWCVGVEIPETEAEKYTKEDVFRHPREKKTYRRLKPGEIVARDQMVVLMDDVRAYTDYDAAQKISEAATAEASAADRTVENLDKIVQRTLDGYNRNVIPEVEYLQAVTTKIRYEAEAVSKRGAAKKAATDVTKAKIVLEMHSLSSNVFGEVQQVLKTAGEGVKAQEPILVIQRFDRLKAIGALPREYADFVRPGDEVSIELPRDIPSASGKTFDQHTTNKSITAVAVGSRGGQPVVVSAAEDGIVHVWDADLKVLATWAQSSAVHAIAVTKPGVDPAMAVVGNDSGVAKLYDLSTPGRDAIRELDGRHDGGVSACAFSPDGRFVVTADERSMHLWEVATGKKKYSFGTNEHHSPITSLHFTPQGRVVSVGKEPSVRVWVVGDKAARVEHRMSARVGDVASLGVTDDGNRLLLDADKSHLDVIHLQDRRKERPLIGVGEAGRFGTFAIWSPELDKAESRLIATSGGVEGVVQVWRAPTENDRAIEYARLVCRDGAVATCASFSPMAEKGFLVVGTKKGAIHLWPIPASPPQPKAVVTHITKSIDATSKTVDILVEFDNPKTAERQYQIRPGSIVTLVVRPRK